MKLFERDESMAITAPGGGAFLLAVVLIVVLPLVGCASVLEPSGAVRDTTGQGRTLSDYHNDVAGCDREVSMAGAGAAYRPAPDVTTGNLRGAGQAFENRGTAFGGPNTEALWQKCMSARGWAPTAPPWPR